MTNNIISLGILSAFPIKPERRQECPLPSLWEHKRGLECMKSCPLLLLRTSQHHQRVPEWKMEPTENVNMWGDIKDPSSSLNFEKTTDAWSKSHNILRRNSLLYVEVNNSTNSEEEVKGLNLQLRTLKSKMSVLLKLMYQFHETP